MYEILTFILSVLIAIAGYCAFPLIFASTRKSLISGKKFTATCFGVNFLVSMIFQLLGSTSHGGAYILWTGVFSSVGNKILKERGVLCASDAAAARPHFREEASQAGLSEFEYAKRQVKPDVIAFCDSHVGSSDVLTSYFDTMVDNKLISRLQADVLLEGYTDPASPAVAQPPQVPQPVATVESPKIPDPQIEPAEPKKPSAPPTSKPESAAPAKRYCKLCGGVVDPQTKKCDKCGKQYFRVKKAWSIAGKAFVALAIVGLTFFSIFQTWNYMQCQSTISELRDALATASDTIESQKKKLTEYEDTIHDKRVEISSLKNSLSFYQKHIVVVPDENPRTYHRYECDIFQESGTSFWAYNIEAAKGKGYKACPNCIDD